MTNYTDVSDSQLGAKSNSQVENKENTLGGRESTSEDIDIDTDALLNTLPQPAFIIDTQHRIIAWNREMEVMTGISREDVLGDDDTAKFFRDDRTQTLADAVVENPDRADETFGADRSGRDQRAYEAEQEMENSDGELLHVHSVATPIEQAGQLQGVIQLIQDNTDVIRRREAMATLVKEVADTAQDLEDGDLTARVDNTANRELLDEDVLEITDAINSIANTTQNLITGLADQVEEVSEAAGEIAGEAIEIDQDVSNQNESIKTVTQEMENVSATMEEVAATSDQVSTAAKRAEEAASKGEQAGQAAHEQMDDVMAATENLVATVEALEERMNAIDEVVEVIADIADQTNMLALNANIEAARAGEAGEGFAVVADEVKGLAEETKQNADEITGMIKEIQQQTRETAEVTESTNQQVQSANDEIAGVLDALDDIVAASQEAADGIGEVAEANDDQAASVEEMTATGEQIATKAEEIEDRIGEITEETAEQRDAIDDMVDHLRKLGAAEKVEREDNTVSRATNRVDEASSQ